MFARGSTLVRAALTVAAVCACERPPEPEREAAPAFRRGDGVVIERRAGEFEEARVLAVEGGRARIQTRGDHSTRWLGIPELYAIRRQAVAARGCPSERSAVCSTGPETWDACRLVQTEGGKCRARLVDGRELTTEEWLDVSELTRLNIERRFRQANERQAFLREAERAGRPWAPPGWQARAKERVVGRRENGFFTAHVHEIEDDGLRVIWASGGEAKLELVDVVPEPPEPRRPAHGDYVLRRPSSVVAPWEPVRVVATNSDDFDVIDDNGERSKVRAGDLLRLSRAP
jgi:hypothetical protein